MFPLGLIQLAYIRSDSGDVRRTREMLATGPAWSEETLPEGITARAWAIADGRTGELLWGVDEDKPAKTASTTKMMCAWVVLRLAEVDPAVWDQTV